MSNRITQEERKRIQDLCTSGKSFHEIEKITGVKKRSVSKICHELDIEFPDYTYSKIAENKDLVIQLVEHGKTQKEIAKQIGCSICTVYKFCKKNNIVIPKKVTEKKNTEKKKNTIEKKRIPEDLKAKAIELRKQGLTYQQIADELDFKGENSVRQICIKAGLIKTPKQERDEKIVEFRKSGMNYQQISEKLNLDSTLIANVCRKNGFTLSKEEVEESRDRANDKRRESNKNSDWSIQAIEKAEKSLIKKLKKQFVYLGGYTGHDCYVEIACGKCGNSFTCSAQSIRKGILSECPYCVKLKKLDDEWIKEYETNYIKKLQEERKREREKVRELERLKKTITKQCVICGKEFQTTNKKKICCSTRCSKSYQNQTKDKRIEKEKVIDKGINTKSLFKRDRGFCWICGGKCDFNDYTMKDGYFIAGDWYPSVDHVYPICQGGEHSWKNVKLAHRICNTQRYFKEKQNELLNR